MTTLIVGGNFGQAQPSKIIDEISKYISKSSSEFEILNGGEIENLPKYLDSDLSLWMPNIENEEQKHYPIKKQGSVLICSKVMRDGYKDIDAVSRIFKMHGNAVIAIYKDKKPFVFRLIDALGNEWYNGSSLEELSQCIISFYNWTKQAVRINTIQDNSLKEEDHPFLAELIEINNSLAKFIKRQCGDRFFGNISTRCQQLFPSASLNFGIYVSPRNSNKEELTYKDMVYINSDMHYKGDKKPSVDSPCQIEIYKRHPELHYMIHGHASIKGAPTTNNYYLCGDVREADEVSTLIKDNWAINLKNHGFLICSQGIGDLKLVVNSLINHNKFYYER